MRRIWPISILSILLVSCIYDAMYFLSDKDMEWMAPYSTNDTIIFTSSRGQDTMIVESKTLYNDHWPFVQNEGTDMYLGNASIKYGIQHGGELLKGDIVIIKKEEDCLYLGIHFGNRHYKCENEKELHFDSFTFEGIKYMDLIKVENSNSVLYDDYYLNTVYFIWSKSKGLLQYKYLKGDVYTFYKKLPYKRKD